MQLFFVIPAGPDRERQIAVAPLPDRDVARVGVRQRDLHDLAGDEGAVLVADLRVIEDRFRRVEDAVLRGRETLLGAGLQAILLAGRLHAILGLAALLEEVVDRLAEQVLDVRPLVERDLLELAGRGGVEETRDGLLAPPARDARCLDFRERRPPAGLGGSAFRSPGGGLR